MIRLIAVDLDDTLLDDRGRLPEANARALREAAARGATVVLATGRMTDAALPFARALGLCAPMIAYNGALVYDPDTGAAIHERALPLDLTREILRAAESEGAYVQYFDRRRYYFERCCGYTRAYGDRIGVAGAEVNMPLSEWVSAPALKLLMVTPEPERDALCERYRARFEGRAHVMATRRSYVEIVAHGSDKGEALRALAASMGVRADETAAFGDAQNDVGMIAWAGLGWCVENGCAEAKAAAKRIAPGNAACGVASAIGAMIAEGLL